MSFARINGRDLFYSESGDGAPIIFGHGIAASHDSWEPVTKRLQDRFRCILTDFRGAGDSNQTTGPCTMAQYAADVVGLADHLGLTTFTYVGHSMGGIVGMQLGVASPDRLEKLVLVATPSADMGIRAAFRDARRAGDEAAILARLRAGFARDVSEEFLQSRLHRLMTASDEHLDAPWSESDLQLGARLTTVQTPTLVVAGAADPLLSSNLADFARLPNATLHVFSRVGHQVTVDVPDALADVIADFMEHGVVNAATLQSRVAAASQASV
jgi:pimeloyl-ACP methyl ester carboxylesterase